MRQKIFNRLLNSKVKEIDYTDDYIRRLNSSVTGEGMLHKGNVYLMDYAIKNMPAADFLLEIGSWAGLSTNLLLHLLKKYNRKETFLGCDPWIYEGINDMKKNKTLFIDGHSEITRIEYMEYIKNSFINSVRFFNKSNLPHTFHLTSDDFFEQFENKSILTDVFETRIKLDGKLSFCYIDGNHSYDYAKRDFENTSKHLVKNGLILFDDSWAGSAFGSSELMKEIKNNPDFEIVFKNPNYLIRKIK